MTESRDPISYDLEAIARAIPETPPAYQSLRALLASLPDPIQPALQAARATPALDQTQQTLTGAASGLVGAPPGFESGAGTGVLPELFYGVSNLLSDPEMATGLNGLGYLNVVGADIWQQVGADWEAMYHVNSGTATSIWPDDLYSRGNRNDNPFNSYIMGLGGEPSTNAYNVDVYFRPRVPWAPNITLGNAFLIAAARFQRYGAIDASVVVKVSMAIVRASDDVIVAESVPVDYGTLELFADLKRLSANYFSADFSVDGWYWLLHLNIVKTGTVNAGFNVFFGEPQLVLSATQTPPPFTPIIGSWFPSSLRYRWTNDTQDRFAAGVHGGGGLEWGPGTAGFDLWLRRTATRELTLSSPPVGTAPVFISTGSVSAQGHTLVSSNAANPETLTLTTVNTWYKAVWECSFTPTYTGQRFLCLLNASLSANQLSNLLAAIRIDNDSAGTSLNSWVQVIQQDNPTIGKLHSFAAAKVFVAAAGDVGNTRYLHAWFQSNAAAANTLTFYGGAAYASSIQIIPLP